MGAPAAIGPVGAACGRGVCRSDEHRRRRGAGFASPWRGTVRRSGRSGSPSHGSSRRAPGRGGSRTAPTSTSTPWCNATRPCAAATRRPNGSIGARRRHAHDLATLVLLDASLSSDVVGGGPAGPRHRARLGARPRRSARDAADHGRDRRLREPHPARLSISDHQGVFRVVGRRSAAPRVGRAGGLHPHRYGAAPRHHRARPRPGARTGCCCW